jgi:putative ABC transport system ATP-binding protein
MSVPLFKADNLVYKANLTYDNVAIHKGKISFIVGESGSGKSTFLKLLNNTISAVSGKLLYNGIPVEEYDPISLRQKVSLISQEPFLFDGTVLDNFKTFYSLRHLSMPKSEELDYFMKLCHVNVPLDQTTTTLSGGERQRVYISIFLSFSPKVILLDEPTSALDEVNSTRVMENIVRFCKEKDIEMIAVSHDKRIVEKFSEDKIEIIKRG